MALVAIEFEDDQLLVAIAQKSGLRCSVSNVFVVDSTSEDDAAAGELLKAKIEEHGAARSETIVIVSRSLAEVRDLTVPPAPDEELPDMIRFQARNEFAALNDQWKLDYVPLTDDPDAPRRVLAAAISSQLETKIQTVCQHAGLKLKRIVLRPFATLDLLKSELVKDELSLIVDQSIDSTDMSVVSDGKLLSTRTVRLPMSLPTDKRAKQLITEVRRTLASHKMSSGGGSINHVVVSGEEARHRHLKGDLEGKLGMTVAFIDPFSLMEVLDRPTNGSAVESAKYACLLGALKAETAGIAPQLDFANFRKNVVKKTDYSKLYLYGGLAALVAFFSLFLAWWVLRSQAQEIETVRARLVEAIKVNEGDGRFPSVDQKLSEVRLIDQWKMEDVNWLTELSDLFVAR